MPLEIARTMMSALWELITVMLWDQNTFVGIFRHKNTKSIPGQLPSFHPRGHSVVRRSDVMLVRFWMKRVTVSD